jgi:long-subunit fatty acid transport protein
MYLGYQANISYAITDMISAALGVRYVSAKNTYKGHINEVTVVTPEAYGGVQTPGNYLRFIAGVVPPAYAPPLNGAATVLDDLTNVDVDAEMTGHGITPIISLDIKPIENLNVSLRYEFKTDMDLKTTVHENKDGNGLFIQDSTVIADLPASISVGVNFKPIPKLMLSGSFNCYFDKNVDYDGEETAPHTPMIDKNFTEFGLGAEYALSDKLRISAGWETTITSVNDNYQSDQRYDTNTNSFGAGLGYRITNMIDINLGGQYTIYDTYTKNFDHYLGAYPIAVTETYAKKTWLIALGLDFHFGAK